VIDYLNFILNSLKIAGDINVEEELKNLLSKEGADGYVIFN
jgi:hypothetical protein